ncbi:MAG: LysM peptidoglycan-binding domain-containing protein [Phycisphaerae bacterium]|nr:LysM peptidoglycan-binding domain-containing protein [Phycisphaerae bacterium]
MALNVKAALLICMGFIGGMSWVVQRVGAPMIDVPSPLAPTALAEAASGVAPETADADWRAARVGRLARRNMVDAELAANRVPGEAVALAPHAEIPVRVPPQPELPPLVYDSGVAVADAAELDAVPPAGEVVLIAGATPTEPIVTAAADPATEEAVAAAPPAGRVYRVAKGDTLTRIVRRECKSDDRRLLALLVDANPKLRARGGRIMAGEDLVLPDPAAVQRVLAGVDSTGVATAEAAGPGVTAEAPAKTGGERWYTIQRNDTLERIAQRYLKDGRRWREIAAMNRALDPHKIVPGTRIKLPPVIRLAQR